MKIVNKILVSLLLALVLIQFFKREKNNAAYREVSAFEAETKPSKAVADILKNNCYDCHSNKTEYPWYAEIAPVSFWIDHHIEEGNEHFNVSQWENYDIAKKDHKLDELIEEVEEDEMPLQSYTILHGSLTKSDKDLLIQWAKNARTLLQVE